MSEIEDDPRLRELLDEIELRAAVELAKYSPRYRRSTSSLSY